MTIAPTVTILMATCNRAGLLSRTIASVRDQTFQDWELVIADDGSSDETPAVVQRWQQTDPRIIYIRNAINQGTSKNYNTGFRIARGTYVAMIDDDDPWCDADKLAEQVVFLEQNPDYVACGGGVIVVDELGAERYRYLKPETDAVIRRRMLFSNPMANSTTMFRRTVAERVGWYDETTRYSGDRDFWLKMGLQGKLYNFPRYFSFYIMSGVNTSITKLRPHLKASLIVMKRYKGQYPGYSSALVINELQYAYSFLPSAVRRVVHERLARLKRRVAG
jgi:glycosyltransferase involved in cell wall biosynthesis